MRQIFFASFCLLATAATAALADEPGQDPSTWRWTATKAIEAQLDPRSSTLAAQEEFDQRWERYSFNGQIEARAERPDQLTPSLRCKLVDDVVYWKTSRFSG